MRHGRHRSRCPEDAVKETLEFFDSKVQVAIDRALRQLTNVGQDDTGDIVAPKPGASGSIGRTGGSP
jgi:hypothetical protein